MPKYKVILDRDRCIGSGSCTVVAPRFWDLQEDGKVTLLDSLFNKETNKWEIIVEAEEDVIENKEAENACPVTAIKIEKIED
ncbi:ferredoxin [Candidatus Woesearchaeota archaeon]|nr:ferredoxin [Candidatus Woesearchaeota archaeon]